MRDQAFSAPYAEGESRLDHPPSRKGIIQHVQKAPVWGLDLTTTLDCGLTIIVGLDPGADGSPPGDIPAGYKEFRAFPLGRVSYMKNLPGQPLSVEVGVLRYGKGTRTSRTFTVNMNVTKFR